VQIARQVQQHKRARPRSKNQKNQKQNQHNKMSSTTIDKDPQNKGILQRRKTYSHENHKVRNKDCKRESRHGLPDIVFFDEQPGDNMQRIHV